MTKKSEHPVHVIPFVSFLNIGVEKQYKQMFEILVLFVFKFLKTCNVVRSTLFQILIILKCKECKLSLTSGCDRGQINGLRNIFSGIVNTKIQGGCTNPLNDRTPRLWYFTHRF